MRLPQILPCVLLCALSMTSAAQLGLRGPQLSSVPQPNDLFGFSVAAAVSGTPRIIVGAVAGSAEIFRADQAASHGRVSFEARFTGVGDDNFGIAVALGLSGTPFAAVGANGDDAVVSNAGKVHTYVFTNGSWEPLLQLTSPNPSSVGNFGSAVSADGDRLAIGEPKYRRVSDNLEVGAVHIYRRVPAPGQWQLEATLEGAQANARFGQAIKLRAGQFGQLDQLAVGAVLEDDGAQGLTDVGALYVFVRSTQWAQQARILAADRQLNDRLGIAVDIQENVLLAGAANDDKTAGTDAGSAYLFNRGGLGMWIETNKLRATLPQPNERFGQSVSLQGNRIAIGAYCSPAACSGSGAVYLFDRASGFRQRLSSTSAGENLGHAVSFGQGPVLAVGAFSNSLAASGAGALYVAAETLVFRDGFED